MNINDRKLRDHNPTTETPLIILSPRCKCCNYFGNVTAEILDSGAACLGTNPGLLTVQSEGQLLMCLCFSFLVWKWG